MLWFSLPKKRSLFGTVNHGVKDVLPQSAYEKVSSYLSHPNVAAYCAAFNDFIFCSWPCCEGFERVCLDAILKNKPVIQTLNV